jgi:hypothetical protein
MSAVDKCIGKEFIILGILNGIIILNSIVNVDTFNTLAEFIIRFSTKAVLFIVPMNEPQNILKNTTNSEADLKVGIISTT